MTKTITAAADTTRPGLIRFLSYTTPTPSSVRLAWTNPADADLAG